jgi:hypothetical protein
LALGLFKPREEDVKTRTQDSSAHGTGLSKVAGSRFGVDGATAVRTISGLIPVLLPGIQTKAANHASIGHVACISRRGVKERFKGIAGPHLWGVLKEQRIGR